MTSPRRLLVVGCGFPQMGLIRKARELGIHVIGADMNADAVGVRDCHDFARVSTVDVDGLVNVVRERGAVGIATSGSERALTATAAVAHHLGLPFYADSETVRRCQEKDAMRDGYERHGVKVPAFAPCQHLHEIRAFATAHGFPLVVKPARGWGQRGVTRVDDASELDAAFEDALAHSSAAGLATAVVEVWLEGREYSVNGWVEGGTLINYCVTERVCVPGKKPLGVMIAEVYPSGLDAEDEARVVLEARRGASALGLRRGPCYSQVVLSAGRRAAEGARQLANTKARHSAPKTALETDGPEAYLFETAARLGGGFDADVTRLASGVDLYARVLGVALGEREWEAEGATGERQGGAVAKFLIGIPGVVTGVDGLSRARALPGIVDTDVFVPVGGRVHPLTDGSKRAGFALAFGASRGEALARADAALAAVTLETQDGPTDDPPFEPAR